MIIACTRIDLQPEEPAHEWVPRELEAMGWPAELVDVARTVLLPDPPPPIIITTTSLSIMPEGFLTQTGFLSQ